jgi:hypothetical protein
VWTFRPLAGEEGGADRSIRADAEPAGWRLQIDTRLEDLAGNSVRRVFDRDLDDAGDDGIEASLLMLALDGGVGLRP